MVDFSLSEDQKEFQKLARDFAQKEIMPKAAYYDETAEYPHDIIKKAIGKFHIEKVALTCSWLYRP